MPDNGPAKQDKTDEDAALRKRLDALKTDLGEVIAEERKEQQRKQTAATGDHGLATGMRAASELAAGVLVGGAIGYLIDTQLGSMPLFLIIMMMFGMGTGFWNMYRMSARTGRAPGKTDGTGGTSASS